MTGEPGPAGSTLDHDLAARFEAHRRELHVHCYRMTGSLADAEDLTQETFLRAWRHRHRFEGRASPRTWLYRIATNACLDHLKAHERRARPTDSVADTLEREAWIDPYPDRLDPAALVEHRQTTDLRLTAALVHLPPRQRAVLIARRLLELDAAETATALHTTATAVHSLLQRAEASLRRLGTTRDDLDRLTRPTGSAPTGSGEGDGPDGNADHNDPATRETELVRAYIDAHHRGDAEALTALLDADVRISMPPEPPCHGRPDAHRFFATILGEHGPGEWLLEPTRANGAPAAANHVRPPGETTWRALSIDVLQVEDGRITAIHCFLGDTAFAAFDLPLTRPPTARS